MKIKVAHLHRMLALLSEKTREPLDRTGLRNMASEIGGISEDYLYKKVYYVIRDLDAEGSISLRDAQLSSVAKFLGYRNVATLISAMETPVDDQLLGLTGDYYIYVRQNSMKGLVFQSPVEIRELEGKFILRLKGPSWTYEGDLKIKHGCLFVLLASPEHKSFYHIYKIGTSRRPRVIQGIFSGVSTAFDPIGGRAVLFRVKAPFSALKNEAFTTQTLEESDSMEKQMLARYFKEYAKNNLSINKVAGFGLEDLEG